MEPVYTVLALPGYSIRHSHPADDARKRIAQLLHVQYCVEQEKTTKAPSPSPHLVTPVKDRTYPLSQVPEAMRYLEQRHPAGKIVITM